MIKKTTRIFTLNTYQGSDNQIDQIYVTRESWVELPQNPENKN